MTFVCPDCGRTWPDGGHCGDDGAALVAARDTLLGLTIGRWRLARLLGEGGMGRVYLAVQPAIGSRVAIKVLSEACARDRGLVDRFFAEARAVNLVRHEHIVSVLDLAWFDDGRPYIVMEYVAGATLGALVPRGPLPLGSLAAVVGEVLSALAAAHAIGIVHRDLKPDNVLVTAGGHAKVLDFGIAKLAPQLQRGDSPQTASGALLGTPDYMAPEQVAGGVIDGRTDLYALGALLYECVTGRRPFAGGNLFEVLRAQVEALPPAPASLRADLPPALDAVIMRALAKRPEDRFATAADMAAALAAATAGLPPAAWAPLPIAAAPPSPTAPSSLAHGHTLPAAPPTAARRRQRGVVVAIAAGVIAVVAIAALAGGGRDERAGAPPPGAPAPAPAPGGVTIITTGGPPQAAARDFDPARFDAIGYLDRAAALARRLAPDAALTRFDVDGVGADGLANLTLSEDFDASYEFRAPARSARPDVPHGVPVDIPCMVYVDVTTAGAEAYVVTREACDEPLRPPPRCRLAEVWARALTDRVPAGTVAQIDYLPDGWFVQVGDELSESILDDCR
ncbi:MAG: serine/threonine protein kinase [Kofleriaceae bacterium]|nr:serine/threonine protein kinase [Kofleriaceae bacterium]